MSKIEFLLLKRDEDGKIRGIAFVERDQFYLDIIVQHHFSCNEKLENIKHLTSAQRNGYDFYREVDMSYISDLLEKQANDYIKENRMRLVFK